MEKLCLKSGKTYEGPVKAYIYVTAVQRTAITSTGKQIPFDLRKLAQLEGKSNLLGISR